MSYRYKKLKMRDGSTIDEHRLVAGAQGRGFDIVVHHIDEDTSNNAPSNLEVMTRSDHAKLHGLGKSIGLLNKFSPGMDGTAVCRVCLVEKPWDSLPEDKHYKNGRSSKCKPCLSEFRRRYRYRRLLNIALAKSGAR